MNVKSVSVIGAGAMGAPIARRILDAGFDLIVCDQSADALASFAYRGVKVTHDPRDCALTDIVLVVVSTVDQMWDVLTGDGGLVRGLQPGAPSPIVAVMSTVGPKEIRALEERMKLHEIVVLDAPVSGGARRAEQGQLSVLTGGDPSAVALARPVLACAGSKLFHCGSVGTAQAIKIVNNVIAIANVVLTAEAYRLAFDNGIGAAELTSILEASSGRNQFSANENEAASAFASWTMTRRDFDTLISILRKDLALIEQLAPASSMSWPFIRSLISTLGEVGDETFENWQAVARSPNLSRLTAPAA